MLRDLLDRLMSNHRGKAIGVAIGFTIGVIVLVIGFWRAFFLCLCTVMGYWLGGMSDRRAKFIAFLERILPEGTKDR